MRSAATKNATDPLTLRIPERIRNTGTSNLSCVCCYRNYGFCFKFRAL